MAAERVEVNMLPDSSVSISIHVHAGNCVVGGSTHCSYGHVVPHLADGGPV